MEWITDKRLIKNKEPTGPLKGSQRRKRKALLEIIRPPLKAGEQRGSSWGFGLHFSDLSNCLGSTSPGYLPLSEELIGGGF